MPRTVLAFFELDATPQHGLTSELAERLGGLTGVAGFVEGALYLRPDHDAVALEVVFDGDDPWLEGQAPQRLIEGGNWRSRSSDVRMYQRAARVEGEKAASDESVFVSQRFLVRPEVAQRLVDAFQNYVESFMLDLEAFEGANVFLSQDRQRVVALTAWAYEAALAALEAKPGSLSAMSEMFGLSEAHVFEAFERVSYMLGSGHASSRRSGRA
jgi:hypothetical protein